MQGVDYCQIIDGTWRPEPIYEDIYSSLGYFHEVGWIIFSAKNTGSQLHVDPDLMGAWNYLLSGDNNNILETNFKHQKRRVYTKI